MFEEMTDAEIRENASLLAEVYIAHRQSHWATVDPWDLRKAIGKLDSTAKVDFCQLYKIVNAIEGLKDREAENLYEGMLEPVSPESWRKAIERSWEHKAAIDALEKEFNTLIENPRKS